MSKDNHIKKFTAEDIERYHKGLLSPRERNALEKAALDDPFLADAMEGYSTTGVHVKEDIEELRSRLGEKIDGKKAVSILPRTNRYYYLRVAAILVLLAGAGWLVYQYTSPGKKPDIAQIPPVNNKINAGSDTTIQNEIGGNGTTANQPGFNNTITRRGTKDATAKGKQVPISTEKKQMQSDSIPNIASTSNYTPGDGSQKEKLVKIDKPEKTDEGKTTLAGKADGVAVVNGAGVTRNAKEANTYAPAPRGAIQVNNLRSNNFKAQVRGNNNDPVPFANVTVLNNNTSIYTDANGNFGVVLTDSVANVEVRSVGYENNKSVLRNNVPADIILRPSSNQLTEVVVTAIKKDDEENENKRSDASPVDGWEKYNAYLQNNIQVPSDLKTSRKGNFVELIFDINKKGQPTNISVETSLNKACNREAIRLLKQGPSWKGNTGRIKIYFK